MTEHYLGEFRLILRPHQRAKYLKLRFDARNRTALLTVPPGISTGKAIQFARKHQDWIEEQDENSPKVTALIAGEKIPYQGRLVTIIHRPDSRGAIEISNRQLIVGGPLPGFEVRLGNWLAKQAWFALIEAVEKFTPVLGLEPGRVVVRDNRSRWGSCSSRKTLSFSWRLILTPGDILHYVAAHEMAHLAEMNHGPQFWQQVKRMSPDYKDARRWLKSEGSRLMLIG